MSNKYLIFCIGIRKYIIKCIFQIEIYSFYNENTFYKPFYDTFSIRFYHGLRKNNVAYIYMFLNNLSLEYYL